MKKNFFIALSILSVAALTVGCGNESVIEEEVQKPVEGYTIPAKVGAARPTDDPATKASFNETSTTLEFTSGDKLFISGTHGTAGQFAGLLDCSDATGGVFEGDIYTQNEVTISYGDLLSGATSVSAQLVPEGYGSSGYITTSGSGYSMTLTTDPAKCISTTKKAAIEQFSCEVATSFNDTGNCFDLTPQNCIITFIIGGLEADKTYTNVKVSSVTTSVASDGVITFNDAAADGAVHVTGSVTADSEGTATVAVAFAPGTTARTYTVFMDDVARVSLSNKSYTAGKSYRVNRPTLTDSDAAGTRGMYKGREAMRVDLGSIPYVVATLNEGARTEEDYGTFYTYDNAKAQFSNSTNSYSVSDVWRLPTKDEFESFKGLSNTWTTVNSVNGRSFEAVSGKTLFLPAAGYSNGGSIYGRGGEYPYGNYWSSTGSNSEDAYYLYFNSYDFYMIDNTRDRGRSVRLFCALL